VRKVILGAFQRVRTAYFSTWQRGASRPAFRQGAVVDDVATFEGGLSVSCELPPRCRCLAQLNTDSSLHAQAQGVILQNAPSCPPQYR